MFKAYHKHLLIKGVITSKFKNPEAMKLVLECIVKKIGMHKVTAPQAYYVTDEGNEGLTGSINLATSHIAMHVWDKTGLLMADVYSCKDFNVEDVQYVLKTMIGLKEWEILVIDRNTLKEIK